MVLTKTMVVGKIANVKVENTLSATGCCIRVGHQCVVSRCLIFWARRRPEGRVKLYRGILCLTTYDNNASNWLDGKVIKIASCRNILIWVILVDCIIVGILSLGFVKFFSKLTFFENSPTPCKKKCNLLLEIQFLSSVYYFIFKNSLSILQVRNAWVN